MKGIENETFLTNKAVVKKQPPSHIYFHFLTIPQFFRAEVFNLGSRIPSGN
jgi:hypothetical protein